MERLEIFKTECLVNYNPKYQDLSVMRVKTQDELLKRHDHIIADILRTLNCQLVTLFHDCCIREKDSTKEQDALRSILCTPEMKEVMLGRRCSLKCLFQL